MRTVIPQIARPEYGLSVAEDPVAVLKRGCASGADYRVLHLSADRAVVELRSCLGEPEDRIESADPRLVEWLRARGREA